MLKRKENFTIWLHRKYPVSPRQAEYTEITEEKIFRKSTKEDDLSFSCKAVGRNHRGVFENEKHRQMINLV